MERRSFIKNASLAAGLMATAPSISFGGSTEKYDFPLLDLHVHTTQQFTIDNIMEIGEKQGVKFGIVDHPISWALKNDAD